MWLKRTRVKTRHQEHTYLQIIHSYNDRGRNRQSVVASLGREEEVDRTLAEGLIKSLNSGISDILPSEEINLLDAKEWSEIALLGLAFNNTGLRRLFSDIGKLDSRLRQLESSVFLIVAYTILNETGGLPFWEWADTLFLPFGYKIPAKADLLASLALLNRPDVVQQAIANMHESHFAKADSNIHFICSANLVAANGEREPVFVEVTANPGFYPSALRVLPPGGRGIIDLPQSIYIFDASISPVGPALFRKANYLVRVGTDALPAWFEDEEQARGEILAPGKFNAWQGGGFRETRLQGRRIFILRPRAGNAPPLDRSFREPRELLVTNLPDGPYRICRMVYQYELFCENLHRLCTPPEITPAVSGKNVLFNSALIRLVLAHNLESSVGRGMQMGEILKLMEGVKAVELSYGPITRRYHTPLNPVQQRIMLAVGFKPHTSLSKMNFT